MSDTSEINNRINRGVLHSEITYEDDGFFSDVPGSGSLSRSLLALNKYVKNNLLNNEDVDEIEDGAYFSKESSPNKSISKYETDSVSSEQQTTRTYQTATKETKGEIKSTSVFTSKALSEPVRSEHNINTVAQTDDYKYMRKNLENAERNYDSNNGTEDHLESKNEPAEFVENENFQEITINPRPITNTVVHIEYSDIRQSITPSIDSLDKADPLSGDNTLPSIVTKAVTLIKQFDDENSVNKQIDISTDNDLNKIENKQYLLIDKDDNSRIYTNLDYNYGNEINHSDIEDKQRYSQENQNRRRSFENIRNLGEIPKQFESSNENTNTDAVVRRHKPFSLKKEDNRHTLHEFSEWGNRTNIYPDVYAPLPYKSPRRYVESDVNIHYRCPVRHDPLPLVPERELARQQAEHMKRLYREQKRNKYLQELQDMQNRRHQDNFTPSQKSVVPLNRYDDADKVIAKALYTFNGQTSRELSFRKGEIIHVRRQIDANWYEGEIHGRVGLFPYNYVEIQKGDIIQPVKKPSIVEGRARAKFDFIAQTNLELPLKKGEVVTLTRRIDQNWWEGRNGMKTGIFPDSYVTILQEPSQNKPEIRPILSTDKPAASPAAHGLLNGSDKRSMGSHSYTPQQNNPALANAPPSTQPLPGYVAKPAHATLTPSERGYGPPTGSGVDLNNTEPLYVDTNAEAIPYRAMYKYRPQNPDELELNEGDTVYVLEKCDDGWYVGSSQRTGRFGTFPGNYVERI